MNPYKLSIDELVKYAPRECIGENFELEWAMTRAERITLLHLLRAFQPELAIEIGTLRGGSLQALARYSKQVISIDPMVAKSLEGKFGNVRFRTGDSKTVLPDVVREVNASDTKAGLVLIDGLHTETGVMGDINAILGLVPRREVCIIMHDSFNPRCRSGIRKADWAACPYVHYVEVDFVSGIFLPGNDTADASMWGGFAVALLRPEPRTTDLEILESRGSAFDIIQRFAAQSGYFTPD